MRKTSPIGRFLILLVISIALTALSVFRQLIILSSPPSFREGGADHVHGDLLVNSSSFSARTEMIFGPIDATRIRRIEAKNSSVLANWHELQPQRFDYINHQCPKPTETRHSGYHVVPTDEPSIAFLFLIGQLNKGLYPEHVWQRWFPPASDPRYHIFVHTNVRAQIPLGPFLCPYAIPPVPTKYYFLHSAMMQLLDYAVRYSNATHFLFMSSTSLPLQHFDVVYKDIVSSGERSRFCLADPEQTLSKWKNTYRPLGINVSHISKGELWSVLSRRHVRVLLKHSKVLQSWNVYFQSVNRKGVSVGATDELFFPTILSQQGLSHEFDNCSVLTGNARGCCSQHYVKWDYVKANDSSRKQWLTPKCAINMGGGLPYHPCGFRVLKESGLKILGASKYLFMRKVATNVEIHVTPREVINATEHLRRHGILWNAKH